MEEPEHTQLPFWQDDDESQLLGCDPHYRLPWNEQYDGTSMDANEDDGRTEEEQPTG